MRSIVVRTPCGARRRAPVSRAPAALACLLGITACAGADATSPQLLDPGEPVLARTENPRDPDGLGTRMVWDGPFQHPESIVHDPWTHTYLVSNLGELVSEDLGALDGNGYVTEITADGVVVEARLVESGYYDGNPSYPWFDLHSPTGILIVGDEEPRDVVVVDRDAVKAFNRYDGNLVWSTPYPAGAAFPNDICRDRDGTLYVTDTGADRLYALERGAAAMEIVAAGGLLHGPNGCVVRSNAVFVANYGAAEGEIVEVRPGSKPGRPARMTLQATLGDHLDGLWWFAGRWFATSWDLPFDPESGGDVWRTSSGGSQVTKVTVEPMQTPADATVDYTRHYPRLLVPSLFGNVILVQPLTNPQTTR